MEKVMVKKRRNVLWLFCFIIWPLVEVFPLAASSSLLALLPKVSGWELSEEPRFYQPENLFEYINGAAESYLSYEFQELVVAQYRKASSTATLTLEIYRFGEAKHAFGIYSIERYPESRFLNLGAQGYQEEGTLNFILGNKYIKILGFDLGEGANEELELFARKVESLCGEKAALPEALHLFPQTGLVPNSEKFFLHNFLGHRFLHDGYLATYRAEGTEFELFLVVAENEEEAAAMLEQFVAQSAKRGKAPQKMAEGFYLQDRYTQNTYVTRVKNYIAGALRVSEGSEDTGLRYFNMLLAALREKT